MSPLLYFYYSFKKVFTKVPQDCGLLLNEPANWLWHKNRFVLFLTEVSINAYCMTAFHKPVCYFSHGSIWWLNIVLICLYLITWLMNIFWPILYIFTCHFVISCVGYFLDWRIKQFVPTQKFSLGLKLGFYPFPTERNSIEMRVKQG